MLISSKEEIMVGSKLICVDNIVQQEWRDGAIVETFGSSQKKKCESTYDVSTRHSAQHILLQVQTMIQ